MLPEQVTSGWDVIAPMLAQSLPPTIGNNPVIMANILTAVLTETADVWVHLDDKGMYTAVILTTIMLDPIMNIRMLLIYCLYGLQPIEDPMWDDGIDSLRRYAKARGCHNVIAYTSFKHVKDVMEKRGVDVTNTLLNIGV